ncbi:MAG: CapA family protein [Caldilineaceae bacterium]
MDLKHLPRSVLLVCSLLLILLGIGLVVWLIGNVPGAGAANNGQIGDAQNVVLGAGADLANDGAGSNDSTVAASTSPTATQSVAAAVPPLPLVAGLAAGIPTRLLTSTRTLSNTTILTNYLALSPTGDEKVTPALVFDFERGPDAQSYHYTFAAATRFDTIDRTIPWQDIEEQWQGSAATVDAETAPSRFTAIAVLSDTLPALTNILGKAGSTVRGYTNTDALIDATWATTPTLALIPFDLLEPRLAVLAIDGQNPVENANKFDSTAYPFVATIYAHVVTTDPAEQAAATALLKRLPVGNRDPDRLTVIAMTGVTAMVRLTAAEMDKRGNGWPAEIVGPELASADITAISNEVPFVPGCETDTRMDNLTFCSKPDYMEALTAAGVDIIGLTGNHQNDYGREDAVASLDIYDAAGLPVYGGGRNKEEAFAPLYLEHNGNRLAFLGANSYGPTFAWATDDQPGSAEFDLAIMSATIRNIKQLGRADVVLAELQYQESYDVVPLLDQRQNFNALINAGADIVTGVQSHVPQAMEFTDGKLILYGLGNLYFDQMWSQSTREGIIVKHTIYNNRHISTQIFTTLLYDYGQPRWTTPAETEAILDRVFGASYW